MAHNDSSFSTAVKAPGLIMTDDAVAAIRQASDLTDPLFVADWHVTGKVIATEVLAGTKTLALTGDRTYNLDPDGANRAVLLPPDATSLGVTLRINNVGTGGSDLVLMDSTNTTQLIKLGNGESWVGSNDSAGGGWGTDAIQSASGNDQVGDAGVCGAAELDFANQPTAGDTLTIGADVYEFLAAAGNVASDANCGVLIGGDAATTLTNLVNAINGVGTGIADLIENAADDGPLVVEDGTEAVFAQAAGTSLLIAEADGVGGSLAANRQSIVLAESITNAASIWNIGNVNLNTIGRAHGYRKQSVQTITVTAAMLLSNAALFIGFPFTPTMFTASVRTSTGILRGLSLDAEVDSDDAFTITGAFMRVIFGATPTLDIVAGDVIVIQAWE